MTPITRLTLFLTLALLLAACSAIPADLPASPPPISDQTPMPPVFPSPTPEPVSPAEALTPVPLPTPAFAEQDDPAAVLGIQANTPPEDAILYARADGAVVLHRLADGSEKELLRPGRYLTSLDAGEGAFLVPMIFPPAASPDGRWLLIATPGQGVWLVATDGSVHRRIAEAPIAATWAPDSRRITFTQVNASPPANWRAIYVQDVVDGGEPRVLTELPDRAMIAYWSPGCPTDTNASDASCGRHIASITCQGNDDVVCAVWIIDVNSGGARDVCRFTPSASDSVPFEYAWGASGSDFLVWSAHRACPLDGEMLPLSQAFDHIHNVISPDGQLWAFFDPGTAALPGKEDALIIRNAYSAAGVFYTGFHNMHRMWWTQDGRHLVITMGPPGENQTIFLLDPAAGSLTPVARNAVFLGVLSHLKRQGVASPAWFASHRLLPDPGPVEDWTTYRLPELKMILRAPATWRVQQVGRGRYVIANFALERAAGGVRLTPDLFEMVIQRSYGRGAPINPEQWLEAAKVTAPPGREQQVITLAGRPATHSIDKAFPLSETFSTFYENFTVTITRSSLNPDYDTIFQQILNTIQFQP